MSQVLNTHIHAIEKSNLPFSSSSCNAVFNEKARDIGFKIPDQNYGSLGNTPSLDLEVNRRRDSVCTTVGMDDNDEGLYLISTHQLLREKGYAPVSFSRDLEEIYSEAKDKRKKLDDDESSISDMSSDEDDDENSHYEQRRKLFSPGTSSLDFTSYSYQASMTSRPSIRHSISRSYIYQEISDADSITIAPNTSLISKLLSTIKCGCL